MRIPLRRIGPTAPEGVDRQMAVFGKNPYGEPQYRIIWSENKMHYFAGGEVPQYEYLTPSWIMERWTPPEVDAGPPELWNDFTRGLLGDYPSEGTYNFVQAFASDWWPSEENVRLVCVALELSRDLTMKQRADGIRKTLEAAKTVEVDKVAQEIVEMQDSASRGLIQQGVSGPKNNFRTIEDYERDMAKAVVVKNLPKHGGKLVKEL